MAWQLVYTSAPRLLEAGRSGFGTVARHREVPPMVVAAVERFSQFSRQPGLDPDRVVSAHRVVVEGGRSYHVLSCIRDAGADYTGRTNHVAHHLIAEEHEVAGLACSSADVLLGMAWLPRWDQLPLWLEGAETVSLGGFPAVGSAAGVHWERFCGDGMKAWLLVSGDVARRGWLVLPDRLTSLGLLADALSLHPGRGWGVSFTTSLQPSDERGSLSWLGVEAGSPVRDYSDALPVLDLTAPHRLPEVPVAEAPEEHPFSEAGASWGREEASYEESYEEAERAGWQAPMRAYPVEEDAGVGKSTGSAAMPALRAEARMDFSTGAERRGAGRSRQWWALGMAVLALVLAGGGVFGWKEYQEGVRRDKEREELKSRKEEVLSQVKELDEQLKKDGGFELVTHEELDRRFSGKFDGIPEGDDEMQRPRREIALLRKLAGFKEHPADAAQGVPPADWWKWENEWSADFSEYRSVARAFQKWWVEVALDGLEKDLKDGEKAAGLRPEHFEKKLKEIEEETGRYKSGMEPKEPKFQEMVTVKKLRAQVEAWRGIERGGTKVADVAAPLPEWLEEKRAANKKKEEKERKERLEKTAAEEKAKKANADGPSNILNTTEVFAVGWEDLAAMEIKELTPIKEREGVKFKWADNKGPSDGKELIYWPPLEGVGGERIAEARLDLKPFFKLGEGNKLTRGDGGPASTDYGDIEVEDKVGHKHLVVHVFPPLVASKSGQRAETSQVAPKAVAEEVRARRESQELILEHFNPPDYLADVVWTVRFNGKEAPLTKKDGAKWIANIPEAVVDSQQTTPANPPTPNPATPDEYHQLFMPDGGKAREWKGYFNTDADKLDGNFSKKNNKKGKWGVGNNLKTAQEVVGLFAELLGTAAGSGGEELGAAGSELKSCPGNDDQKLRVCLEKALEAAKAVALNGNDNNVPGKKDAFDRAKETLTNKLKHLIEKSKSVPPRPAAALLPPVASPTAQPPQIDYEVVFSKKPKNGAPPLPRVLYFKKRL